MDQTIYVTEAGLNRRQEEYRHVTEVEIPKNTQDIGRARAFGDLSENAEYTEALRQQQLLTGRAAQMELEFSRVRLIDFSTVTGEKVTIGTTVKIKNETANETSTWTILGPWDCEENKPVMSYMSAVAEGLMGKKAGETAEILLPGAEEPTRFKVLEVAVAKH